MGFKKDLFYNVINLFGWKTNRKLLVFESDDWGGIRTPTKAVYNSLQKHGIKMDANEYSMFDGFERKVEYDRLGDVLIKFKDSKGKHPVFTLNMSVANPDFTSIRNSKLTEYFFETFIDSYKRFGDRAEVGLFDGIKSNVFFPQLHGREHMNIFMWMDLLNSNQHIRTAFDHDCYALGFDNSDSIKIPYLASFAPYKEWSESYGDILKSAQSIFYKAFGFNATTFIAPVYLYTRKIESHLTACGIKGIQGLFMHKDPDANRNHFRFLSSRTNQGHIQLVRNCFFEPSSNAQRDWVAQCLNEIGIAFKRNKPAVVSAHRLNFNGSLVQSNADENLRLLSLLLKGILQRWPNVEFLNTHQLNELIANDYD